MASAQEPEIRFTVRPAEPDFEDPRGVAWLIHEAPPGRVIRDAVHIENLGTAPVDLVLYPADGVTTDAGDFTVEPREAPRDDVATWVEMRQDQITLDPGESTRVRFRVRIPENAMPGDHPGGIVARTVEPVGTGDVTAYLAVAARLYLTVEGPLVYDLRITGVEAVPEGDRTRFLLGLENAGNTLLEVTGRFDVRGLFGTAGEGELASPATLVPGATATREVVLPKRLLGGRYVAAFDLAYGPNRTVSAETAFFVWPPWQVLLAVALILANGVALLFVQIAYPRPQRRLGASPG